MSRCEYQCSVCTQAHSYVHRFPYFQVEHKSELVCILNTDFHFGSYHVMKHVMVLKKNIIC